MTAHRELKTIIRARQRKTGESYTAARVHVMRMRTELLEPACSLPIPERERPVEGIVLKVNRDSARVRIPTEDVQVTVRSTDATEVVPGHVVTLVLAKRWTWRGDAYASGRMLDPHIDIAKLGLTPLPLREFDLSCDLRTMFEPFRSPDPYFPMWRRLTAKPRACYDMDPIAWGAFADVKDSEDNPTCDASELFDQGDAEGARDLLMGALLRDLRCIDAHVHLGSIEFDRWPQRASLHYEIGVGIGELSLPPGFDGALIWGRIYNRPFLRGLHGLGLSHWRLGRAEEALTVFERILALNPNDNQGIRFLREALLEERTWDDIREAELAER